MRPLLACIAIFAALLLPVGTPAPSRAASFDCAKAQSVLKHSVCADPSLSALDDQLAHTFSAELALTLDPAALRADEADWLAALRGDAADTDALRTAYALRIKILSDASIRLTAGEPGRRLPDASLGSACLPALADDDGGDCAVTDSGRLATIDGHAFSFAAYQYAPGHGDLPYGRVAVLEAQPDGTELAIIAPEPDAATMFSTPEIIHSGTRTLLHIAAYEDGTGNFNRERLFAWHDGKWNPVDVTGWLRDLARRLPNHLAALQGIFPDYAKMTATTLLWRPDDGNACPMGGAADLTLGWRGDRLVLAGLRVKQAGDCGQ